MVLRIGCSKGFTLSLLTLCNWQSTAGEAARNMPVAFRDGSYGLFFMMLHKKNMANYNSCYGCAKPARGLFVLNDFFPNFIVLQSFKDLKGVLATGKHN